MNSLPRSITGTLARLTLYEYLKTLQSFCIEIGQPMGVRLFILFILSLFSIAQGQQILRSQECIDQKIHLQADSLKQLLSLNAFKQVKEASISMESGYEWPIMAPLQAGMWYEFVFIADTESKLLELRMYDEQEKEVIYKKNYGDINGNIIRFSYRPKWNTWHSIRPVQINKKKKQLCGYILLFKKEYKE